MPRAANASTARKRLTRKVFPLETKLLAAFVIGGVGLLATVVLSAMQGSAYLSADREVGRLRDLDHAVTALYLAVRSAESGQRGYLLTSRDSDLTPYRIARSEAAQRLDDARALAGNDPGTLAALDAMRPHVHARLAELSETLDVFNREGFDAAQRVVATGRGSGEMKAIRDSGEAIHADLAARAAAMQVSQREHFDDTLRSIYVGAALALMLLALVYAALAMETAQRRRMGERIRREADHDELTQLPNRRFFTQWLGYALALARREGTTLGLLCIDIDGFKRVNDTSGHEAGDALLVEIARRFSALKRDSDVLARLGGDEFVLAAVGASNGKDLARLAQRMIDSLIDPPVSKPQVGASIGIAFFPDDASDLPGLLATADAAMYAAKRGGRNRVVFHAVAEIA